MFELPENLREIGPKFTTSCICNHHVITRSRPYDVLVTWPILSFLKLRPLFIAQFIWRTAVYRTIPPNTSRNSRSTCAICRVAIFWQGTFLWRHDDVINRSVPIYHRPNPTFMTIRFVPWPTTRTCTCNLLLILERG